jgi:hypothetical protein
MSLRLATFDLDGTSDADMFARVRVAAAINLTSGRVRAAAALVVDGPDLRPLFGRLKETVPGWMPT